MQKLPDPIEKYIRNEFESGFISDVQIIKANHYRIDYETKSVVYHLEFDNSGNLVKKSHEVVFGDDYSYSDFFTDD